MAYLLVKGKEMSGVRGGCGARASPGHVGMGSRVSRYLDKKREGSRLPRFMLLFDKNKNGVGCKTCCPRALDARLESG